jgi:hypothetical protein
MPPARLLPFMIHSLVGAASGRNPTHVPALQAAQGAHPEPSQRATMFRRPDTAMGAHSET